MLGSPSASYLSSLSVFVCNGICIFICACNCICKAVCVSICTCISICFATVFSGSLSGRFSLLLQPHLLHLHHHLPPRPCPWGGLNIHTITYMHITVTVLTKFLHCCGAISLTIWTFAFLQLMEIDVDMACIILFVICVFYTTMGGIKAVIWTDLFQVTFRPHQSCQFHFYFLKITMETMNIIKVVKPYHSAFLHVHRDGFHDFPWKPTRWRSPCGLRSKQQGCFKTLKIVLKVHLFFNLVLET